MSRSVLLDLARTSIEEVLQATDRIDRDAMIRLHPVLSGPVASFVTIWIGEEIRGSSGTAFAELPLIDDLVLNAKRAAFEDPAFAPLTITEYHQATIEVSLLTAPERVEYQDISELESRIRPGRDGLLVISNSYEKVFLPNRWVRREEIEKSLIRLEVEARLSSDASRRHPSVYLFQAETAFDTPRSTH